MKTSLKNWWFSSSSSKPTKFKRLEICDWKQFSILDIEFHERLTILTDPNGCGKTTILNILASHFKLPINELNTPTNLNGEWRFYFTDSKSDTEEIGTITYENGVIGHLQRSTENSITYQIKITSQQNVPGYYLPEQRQTFRYLPVEKSNLTITTLSQAFKSILNIFKAQPSTNERHPTSYYIKQTLLSSNDQSESNQDFIDFQEILRKVLPKTLGFNRLEVRGSEVVVLTNSDEWLLDGASGGISTLIDLAWQIFIFDKESDSGITMLIDEIENHLHASLQRSILPDLVSTFPKVQFIIATHSPLIIGSVKDSSVYTLKNNENLRVESELLDLKNKAKSATIILNQILGVPFTMPIWVEDELKRVVSEFTKGDLNDDTLKSMRLRLREIGLEDLMPEAIKDLIDGKVN